MFDWTWKILLFGMSLFEVLSKLFRIMKFLTTCWTEKTLKERKNDRVMRDRGRFTSSSKASVGRLDSVSGLVPETLFRPLNRVNRPDIFVEIIQFVCKTTSVYHSLINMIKTSYLHEVASDLICMSSIYFKSEI